MTNLDAKYSVENRSDAFSEYGDGTLVCLAGPGTGKTFSLLRRIDALTKRGEPTESICYLTFIKEISTAFTVDYIEKFGLAAFEEARPRVSTLHSFACRLLRNRGFQVGFDGELNFISLTDTEDPASRIILVDALGVISDPIVHTPARLRQCLDEAKASWRDCLDPNEMAEITKQILPPVLDLLHSYRLIDWDQTIPLAHELLEKLPERPNWISQIKHFLVDEYQDFNCAEQAFITALRSNANSTVIVGDDNQSLYSGRGGSPDGLRHIYSAVSSDQVSLVMCRRCKSRIVEVANSFAVATLGNPIPMQAHDEGGEVVAYNFKSSKAELAFLKNYLAICVAELPQTSRSRDGIVCLFPSWRVLDFYYDQISPELQCAKRKDAPNATRLSLERSFRLTAHPNQRFLERLVLEQFDSIKPRHKKSMINLMLERDISPTSAMESLISEGSLDGEVADQAAQFIEFCAAVSSGNPDTITDLISDPLHLNHAHVHQCLEEFLESLGKIDEDEAIRRVCDALVPESALAPEDPRAILFLTIHGSKGLTKKTVVMPGLEAAWLPGTKTGDVLQESRRMFYVALTRATDTVLITSPQRRAPGDPLNFSTPGLGQPSPFIAEAGIQRTYHS